MFILLLHEIHHSLSTKTTKQSVFCPVILNTYHLAKPRRWASTPRWCNHRCLLHRHDHPTSSDFLTDKNTEFKGQSLMHLGVGRVEVVTGELWKQESMLMLLEFHTSSTWHYMTISESKWIFPVNCHAPARHNDRTWKHQAAKFGQSHRRPRWKAASWNRSSKNQSILDTQKDPNSGTYRNTKQAQRGAGASKSQHDPWGAGDLSRVSENDEMSLAWYSETWWSFFRFPSTKSLL